MNAGEGIREDKGERVFDINEMTSKDGKSQAGNEEMENADPNQDLAGYSQTDLVE
jgi:hypothetical protein